MDMGNNTLRILCQWERITTNITNMKMKAKIITIRVIPHRIRAQIPKKRFLLNNR
jgi:hypothetical protein